MVRLICIVGTLSLFWMNLVHADQSQALSAMAQGDYQRAAGILLNLANDGDAEAQYNLALLYQQGRGVSQDKNISTYWFSMAARQGLAQAYTRINSRSVSPTQQAVTVALALGPEAWVAAQEPGNYTLQLASSTNKELIAKYYEENELDGKAGYYRSKREGEEWYALIYGSYPSVQDAKDAIESLPDDLKKWSPWVRNIKSIHRIMLR